MQRGGKARIGSGVCSESSQLGLAAGTGLCVREQLQTGVVSTSDAWLWRYTWQRMAWRFRKSLKFGPLKVNLSKSGVGYSIGGRGFRVGQDAKGRSYTAASIPGTGLYSRTYSSKARASSGNAAGLPGAPQDRTRSIGLAVGMLALAFIAGGLVVAMVMSHPATTAPITPPAALSAPLAPPQPIPAKRRRAHTPKRASAPKLQGMAQPPAKSDQNP